MHPPPPPPLGPRDFVMVNSPLDAVNLEMLRVMKRSEKKYLESFVGKLIRKFQLLKQTFRSPIDVTKYR